MPPIGDLNPHQYLVPSNVEDAGEYRRGGFLSVHPGDAINKRYHIVSKLGHGGTSTVWLVRDILLGRFDAMAIHKADASDRSRDQAVGIWDRLKDGKIEEVGRANVLIPRDMFDISGPNGTHFCMVFPLAGQTICAATNRNHVEKSRPLPLPMVKRVGVDIMQGLRYAHSMQLVHGGKQYNSTSI